MRLLIYDLHQQIAHIHREQHHEYSEKPLVLYRGQRLSLTDLRKLRMRVAGLLSFNSFLSTIRDKTIALSFADSGMNNMDSLRILFIIRIPEACISTPFASTRNFSYLSDEEEILFSMHTIFRITSIDERTEICTVELELTDQAHPHSSSIQTGLRETTTKIRVHDLTKWLISIGEVARAHQFHQKASKQQARHLHDAEYFTLRANIEFHRGNHEQAMKYSLHSHYVLQATLPENHPDLATSYNNIASVYNRMGDHQSALSFYIKSRPF